MAETWGAIWGVLAAAGGTVALVLIIEGLVPFFSPRGYKNMVQQMATMPDNMLRNAGLGLMVAGIVALYLVRG